MIQTLGNKNNESDHHINQCSFKIIRNRTHIDWGEGEEFTKRDPTMQKKIFF